MPYTEKSEHLNGMAVMFSASIPTELAQTGRAQDLYTAIVLFTNRIAAYGGRIVFGGHPTITPLMRQAAVKLNSKNIVDLYQLKRFKNLAPKEIWDADVFYKINWFGDESDPIEDNLDSELGEMRDAMAAASEAAIFIGGRITESLSTLKGIRDEYQRFMAKHPQGPVYLTGFMDGETGNIIRELKKKNEKEENGLSDAERNLVYHSHSIDLIVSLIMDDLCKQLNNT